MKQIFHQRSTLTLALALLINTGCGLGKATNIGKVINSVGKHPVRGQFFEFVEIREDDDSGALRLWVGKANGVNMSVDQELTPGWFFFVESESRLWTYYGSGDLQLTTFSGSKSLGHAPFSFSEIPPLVFSQLPEELKQELGKGHPGKQQPVSVPVP